MYLPKKLPMTMTLLPTMIFCLAHLVNNCSNILLDGIEEENKPQFSSTPLSNRFLDVAIHTCNETQQDIYL